MAKKKQLRSQDWFGREDASGNSSRIAASCERPGRMQAPWVCPTTLIG
jgi:hypothetical protein